jgi:hypothetical protein
MGRKIMGKNGDDLDQPPWQGKREREREIGDLTTDLRQCSPPKNMQYI